MTLTWDFPALATWKQLDLEDAYIVARAAVRFAETGEGDLRWAPPYYRLRAGRHDLILAIDHGGGSTCVLHVYRAR